MVRLIFVGNEDGAGPVELTYHDDRMTIEEARLFEREVIEGCHTGQMLIEAGRRKVSDTIRCGSPDSGAATHEATRQGLGEMPESDTAAYFEAGHSLAAEEAERLRAELAVAEDRARERGRMIGQLQKSLAAEVERRTSAEAEVMRIHREVDLLVSRHAKT